MSGRIILQIRTKDGGRKDILFEEHDTFLFGRQNDCHIYFPGDDMISRHHFLLEINPPDARVRDLGSRNGTYVNGVKYGGREYHETPEQVTNRPYPEVDLKHGDILQVGSTLMRLQLDMPALAAEPIVCQRCGRDVSAEVGGMRHGEYVCHQCKQQNDPIALLMALLQQVQANSQQNLNIPDYNIERKLGEGGMGAVYLARHRREGFHAALKVMLSKVAVDDHAKAKFMREIDNTRILRHKNIVEFLDQGASGSVFYFLLEFCEGGSLSSLMEQRGGRLSLKEAVPFMVHTLNGLSYAHSRGFVHRDLKPHNILLSNQGGQWVAKVADMGLSKNFNQAGLSGMTQTGDAAGSFLYMPREQLTNFRDFKPVSDVWSAGATFYNMLTGAFPRDYRHGQDPIDMVLNNPIIPISQRDRRIPPRLAEVIDRSLTSNVQDRYQNAGEMLQALAAAI